VCFGIPGVLFCPSSTPPLQRAPLKAKINEENNMTKLVQGVLTIVNGLSAKDRKQLVRGMLDAGLLTEDEQDRIVIESRRRDRTRPLGDFVKEMKQKGRLR
jgi:hypothetical protein